MWIRNIEKAARTWNIPVFFRGWGSLRPVVKPDLENDQTLVIVSIDGYHRGKGLGGATNFLATQAGLGGDVYFTRPSTDADPSLFYYPVVKLDARPARSEEHTSELQSLKRNSYSVFCLKKKQEATNKLHRSQHNS